MTVNNLTGSTPLVLKELDVPGRTGPVSQTPDVWGLNFAAVQGNFPKQGLLCRAGPWGVMSRGDKLVISLGGQPVLNKTIDAHEVNTTLSMFVPATRFSDGVSTLDYAVTRQGGTAEPSEVMQVRVKLSRPGGHDSDEGPGHSKLKMTIPKEILEGGIDKDNVAAGVSITIGPSDDGPEPYPYATAGDWIQVTWGGVFVLHGPLTQDQADGKVPLVVHISEAVIREAGDSDTAGLAVAFEVYDLVENRSDDWSYEQRVVVAVDADRLDAPICKEALNNVLDADKLGDADGTAQILAVDSSKFKVGDTPIVRLKGTPREGLPINLEITGEPLVSVPSIPEIKISNAALRQLAQTQIGLSIRLKKADGSADLLSKTQFINVIGEIQRLQAPVALDASQGTLDPELAQARIQIPFDKSFAAGQAIKLFWLGTRPDKRTYLPDLPLRPITNGDITAGVPLLINVPGLHLEQIKGGTLELYYQLLIEDAALGAMNHVNATHAIRESIHAEILNVGEPMKELPEPIVDGVVDGVLPVDTAGTTLTVDYRNTVKDDEVLRVWDGSITGPDEDSVKLSAFTAGQPVPFTIKAELIRGNEGGTVEASYSIKWADGRPTSYSDVKTFSVGVALDLTAPRIKEAPDDTSLVPIAAKDALTAIVDYVGMLLGDKIIVSWTGAAGTPAGGSHTALKKTVTVLGPQKIPLANSVVAFNLNKTVTVSYTVKRESATPLPSDIRTLNVLPIANGDSNFPMPVIGTYSGTELDVSALTGSERTRTGGWPFIAQDQKLWLRYFGIKDDETPYTQETYLGSPVPQAGLPDGMYPNAPVAELRLLKHDSELRIEQKVTLDGSPDETTAVTLPVRKYTVQTVELVTPTINTVKGADNIDIPNNGATAYTTLTLTGTASDKLNVEIFDGTVSKGTAPVTAGIWTKQITGLVAGAHSFTAKGLYGSNPVSPVRTLSVVATVTPEISTVKGADNDDIPNGGATAYTTLTLTGMASDKLNVEIFDGTVSKGTAPVTAGTWTKQITGLVAGVHSFTAKGLYGSNPVSTPPRTLSVVAVVTPTINTVKGADNDDIPNGGATTYTTLTLTGTASDKLNVEIFDGTVSKGTAPVTAGTWTKQITGLVAGAHSFTAKGLYGSNPVSTPPRTLSVVAVVTPTINTVKGDDNDDIPNGGGTTYTTLTLTGTASDKLNVEIFDGTVSKGTAPVTAGTWTKQITGLVAGVHSFTAKGLYGSNPVSTPPRRLSVIVFVLGSVFEATTGREILEGGTTNQTKFRVTATFRGLPVPVGEAYNQITLNSNYLTITAMAERRPDGDLDFTGELSPDTIHKTYVTWRIMLFPGFPLRIVSTKPRGFTYRK